jgi:nucleolar protein 6
MGKEIKKSVPRSERKAKKRKAEDAIPDVPEDYENNDAEGSPEVAKPKSSKKRKHDDEEVVEDSKAEEKSSKKSKKAEEKDEAQSDGEDNGEGGVKLSKKERKALRKAREAEEKAAAAAKPTTTSTPSTDASAKSTKGATESTADAPQRAPKLDADGNPIKKKNNRNREKKRLAAAALAASGEKAPPRFIVFVGNLPYTATHKSIMDHFAALKPASVRHQTHKDDPKKSKGFAFVEFEGYDTMKTCLKTYHHSKFDDGKSAPRQINVELTAGGGGNTKERKDKIRAKNEKLTDQRTRRIGEEVKVKEEKRNSAPVGEADISGIHPSRRGRVAE